MLRILLLAGYLAHAQDWIAKREMYEGQPVRISTRDGKRFDGWFLARSADAIQIRTRTGERSFARHDVQSIHVQTASRRERMAKGALIGASIPLFVALIGRSGEPLPYVAPFFVYGAGLGALANTHVPVYRRNVP